MDPEQSLSAFGFTQLEARLYCALLRDSPATGYQLAKAVGKAQANTYQALASLLKKGAVLVDEGTTKRFRPFAPDELLGALERQFAAKKALAAGQLARIARAPEGDRIYQLKDATQLYERALTMIENAGEIILFDLFPQPFAHLSAALEEAAKRSVVVAGLVYENLNRPSGLIARSAGRAPFLRERWPGAQLSLVVDAQQHLLALLSENGAEVLHGVWSDSPYLSCLQHNGMSSEIRLLDAAPNEDDHLAEISLLSAFPAGLRTLLSPTQACSPEEL